MAQIFHFLHQVKFIVCVLCVHQPVSLIFYNAATPIEQWFSCCSDHTDCFGSVVQTATRAEQRCQRPLNSCLNQCRKAAPILRVHQQKRPGLRKWTFAKVMKLFQGVLLAVEGSLEEWNFRALGWQVKMCLNDLFCFRISGARSNDIGKKFSPTN